MSCASVRAIVSASTPSRWTSPCSVSYTHLDVYKRQEHNCVARDIVQVGDCLLFGYNVFMGLKKTTRVEDVFSLYRLVEGEAGYDVVPVEVAGSFLAEPAFAKDFGELFAYYQHARLLQLVVRDGLFLAAFQIGERIDDMRVFRWSVGADGSVRYVDNRGCLLYTSRCV